MLGFGGEIAERFNILNIGDDWKQYSCCIKHCCKLFGASNTIGAQSWISLNYNFGKRVNFDANGNLQIVLTAGSDSGRLSCFPSVYECFVDSRLKEAVMAIETPSDVFIEDEHRQLESSQFQ